MSKRIALLFHGIVGGVSGQNGLGKSVDVDNCAKLIQNFIIKFNPQYDFDIFIHSWSTEWKENLIKIYKPIVSQFQEQEYFGLKHDTRAYPVMSRFVSLSRAIELKKEYEKVNSFKYDIVMALRFDLVFFAKLDFNNVNSDFIYVPYDHEIPKHKNPCQLHDIFIVANSENMNSFTRIPETINNFIKSINNINSIPKISPHVLLWDHVVENFGENKIKYILEHYTETVIYRHVVSPELNPIAKKYNMHSLKDKLNKTLKNLGKQDV